MTGNDIPAIGVPEVMQPGVARLIAGNGSPMTWWGTNTYLVGQAELAIIDPGPDDDAQLAALMAACKGRKISHIFVTHAHVDHSPLAARLSAQTGAPVLGFGDPQAGRSIVMQRLAARGVGGGGEGVDHAFAPTQLLADGDCISGNGWQLTAHHTPGHFGNHMCFALPDGAVFSGDHVMGWASSLVSPPDGDVSDFMASCRKLAALQPRILYPGHGAPVLKPQNRISWLLKHRTEREAQILASLAQTPLTATEITAQLYGDTPWRLRGAAQRNVFAHLVDLCARNLVASLGEVEPSEKYRLR
ncbi:MAG: MBL fold metallo-hydrolase [Rhodobacteraceae bacterium]|nr:MBL fold metallo-hydrolase [Paracoccaceae bacterium]